ncbi:MAG: DUF2334 domain-containing protein [Chthoniobacterales bacterium]
MRCLSQRLPCHSFPIQALVVSIHDVSPLTQSAVSIMLADLKKIGVTRCSLLVIPDHHYSGMISKNPDFVRWLQEQAREGHEIVLHGLCHLRPAAKKENWMVRWITQHYTAGEGEFYDINYETACEKLKTGEEQLRLAGISDAENRGFIAPAWLLSGEAERALADNGFLYTTRLGGLIVFKNKRLRCYEPAQSMVYSVRSAVRRFISLFWNEALFYYSKKWSLLRIGLHPPDWKYRDIHRHALSSIRRALIDRTAMTYREWVLALDEER